MQLDVMMLAEEAQERDGFLDIKMGGWDTITVQREPDPSEVPEGWPDGAVAPLTGALVIRLLFHKTECGRRHEFTLTIMDEDGGRVGQADGVIDMPDDPDVKVGWDHPLPMVIPLPFIPLPKWGSYTITLQVNGQHVADKPFRIEKAY